jgi:hypothetical protein
MIYIAHRGNINGRIPDRENHPDYIMEAIKQGYDVEIDIRYVDGSWWLGHDEPQYRIKADFLFNTKLWIHCKNWEALNQFRKWHSTKYFWHQNDDYTIIAGDKILVKPGQQLLENSICCMPEMGYCGDISNCYALMTDEILKYRKI